MDNIKVSVVVPTYNAEMYLRETLESLVNQTLKEIEILVVDNNSTDKTYAIIEEYSLKYPSKIVSLRQTVKGPSAARNKGIQNATGEYIGFVDSDDTVELDMFEKMYNKALLYDSDLVLCAVRHMERRDEFEVKSTWKQANFPRTTNIFKMPKLLFRISTSLCDKLYKAETIKVNKVLFDESISYGEGTLFLFTYLYYAKKVSCVYEPLYNYVRRDHTLTTILNDNILGEIEVYANIIDFYKSHDDFLTFSETLLWKAIGVGMSKLRDQEFSTMGSNLKYKYISAFIDLLSAKFPREWKYCLRTYETKGNRFKSRFNHHLTIKKLIKIRIYTPNRILKMAKKIL